MKYDKWKKRGVTYRGFATRRGNFHGFATLTARNKRTGRKRKIIKYL